MSYLPRNFVIFVYLGVTSSKIVCPWGITFSQQGIISWAPISNISSLSIKRRLTG